MSALIKTNFVGRLYIADISRYLEGDKTYEISDKDWCSSKILHSLLQRKPPLITIFRENRKAVQNVVERVVEKNNPEEVQKIVEAVLRKLQGQLDGNFASLEKKVTEAVKDFTSRMPGRAELPQEKSSFISPDSSIIRVEPDKQVKSDVKIETRVSEGKQDPEAIVKLRELRRKQ